MTPKFCLRCRDFRDPWWGTWGWWEREFASLSLRKAQKLYFLVNGGTSACLPCSPQMGVVPMGACGGWRTAGHLHGEAAFPACPPLSLPGEPVLGSQTRDDWTCWVMCLMAIMFILTPVSLTPYNPSTPWILCEASLNFTHGWAELFSPQWIRVQTQILEFLAF